MAAKTLTGSLRHPLSLSRQLLYSTVSSPPSLPRFILRPDTVSSDAAKIPPLVPGCNYGQWLMLMQSLDDGPLKHEMIDHYVQTLTTVFGGVISPSLRSHFLQLREPSPVKKCVDGGSLNLTPPDLPTPPVSPVVPPSLLSEETICSYPTRSKFTEWVNLAASTSTLICLFWGFHQREEVVSFITSIKEALIY